MPVPVGCSGLAFDDHVVHVGPPDPADGRAGADPHSRRSERSAGTDVDRDGARPERRRRRRFGGRRSSRGLSPGRRRCRHLGGGPAIGVVPVRSARAASGQEAHDSYRVPEEVSPIHTVPSVLRRLNLTGVRFPEQSDWRCGRPGRPPRKVRTLSASGVCNPVVGPPTLWGPIRRSSTRVSLMTGSLRIRSRRTRAPTPITPVKSAAESATAARPRARRRTRRTSGARRRRNRTPRR